MELKYNVNGTSISRKASIQEFNAKIRQLYANYNKAVNENKYEEAIKIGKEILKDLLFIARRKLITSISSADIRRLVEDIIDYHEKNLGYIEGVEEAVSKIPVLYSFEVKERALATLSASIQELFSFILGALVILADNEKLDDLRNDKSKDYLYL